MWRHCECVEERCHVRVTNLLYRFGHQDCITSIDCLSRERPVTAGANDRTVRVWKIVEESQLVFNGHKLVHWGHYIVHCGHYIVH